MANDIMDYDFRNDSLFLKKRQTEYGESLDFGDFIIDIDKKREVCGIEILNASKYFKLEKFQIKKIRSGFIKIEITQERLILDFSCKYEYRNKEIEKNLIYNDINTLINQNILGELTIN